tara:strand:+ start:7 stop:2067 length:2061 start_codon:yes stop_codon:yes gene_type:complete
MKWIGQHIWDFISRFRSDVYFEAVPDGTIDSGKNLGLDTNNKLVKAAGDTGGGDVTIVDMNDVGTTTVIDSAATTITIQGADIEAFANGPNNVLIASPPIVFAPNYNTSSANVTNNVSSLPLKTVGVPQEVDGYSFYCGDFSGDYNRRVAKSGDTITYTTGSQCSKMEGNPKIEVKVFGPQSTNSSTNYELGTYTHEVVSTNTSSTGNANGITVNVTSITNDGLATKRKGVVSVTIDPSDSNLITTSNLLTGSQKYTYIQVRHISNDTAIEYGSYSSPITTSSSFFYDNTAMTPTPGSTAVVFLSASSQEKLLSNIAYYTSGGSSEFRMNSSGHANTHRDCGWYSSTQLDKFKITVEDSTTSLGMGDYTQYRTTDKHTDGVSGSLFAYRSIPDDKFLFSHAQGYKSKVSGAWSDSGYTAISYDSTSRNFNSYSSSSNNLNEDFKDEDYRWSGQAVAAYKNTPGAMNKGIAGATDANWYSDKAVGSGTIDGTINLSSNNQFLVQAHDGSRFRLMHANDAELNNIAADPSHNYSNPSQANNFKMEYYRYFKMSGSSTSSNFSLEMTGMSFTEFFDKSPPSTHDAGGNNTLEVHVMVPGDGLLADNVPPTNTDAAWTGRWIPLHVNVDTNNPGVGCYVKNSQATTGEKFDIGLPGSTGVLFVRIKMDNTVEDSNTYISSLQLYTSNQNE